jgi:hypothetical protein
MVITTQEDVDRIKARYDPIDLDQMIKNKEIRLPKVGQLLPKELRAKKLMSQKTTAVADVAFVLGLQAEGPDPEEAARLKEERRKEWWNNISRGAKARARKRARLLEGKEAQLEARRRMAMKADGSVGLNADAARRIAMEYRVALAAGGDQVDLAKRGAEVEEKEKTEVRVVAGKDQDGIENVKTNPRGRTPRLEEAFTNAQKDSQREQLPSAPSDATEKTESAEATTEGTDVKPLAAAPAAAQGPSDPKEVRVLWADLRDAAYAAEWPETVVHAELERMAVAKSQVILPQGRKEVLVPKSRSIHVIGGQKGSGWYLDPKELEALRKGPSEEAKLGKAGGAEGAEDAGVERSGSDQEHASREDAAEALRETGIEVETPKRGLWARAKGFIGR